LSAGSAGGAGSVLVFIEALTQEGNGALPMLSEKREASLQPRALPACPSAATRSWRSEACA
jgi:hypothetical protein